MCYYFERYLCVVCWFGWERRKSYSLTSHPPPTESDFWPTMLSREQRGSQKSDPGGNHYYVGCLCQARVLIPEYLISDHRHAFYSVKIPARCILQTIRSTILFIRPLLIAYYPFALFLYRIHHWTQFHGTSFNKLLLFLRVLYFKFCHHLSWCCREKDCAWRHLYVWCWLLRKRQTVSIASHLACVTLSVMFVMIIIILGGCYVNGDIMKDNERASTKRT